MQYPCESRPLSRCTDARMKTLCDLCKSKDCENPIETKLISIVGISSKHRVYSMKSTDHVVVKCDGFVT